jgi:hypothetical protein
MEEWVRNELATMELGDKRLNGRCGMLLERFADAPEVSVPMACRGWAETMVAYRFPSNETVGDEKILARRRETMLGQISQHPAAFIAQDVKN